MLYITFSLSNFRLHLYLAIVNNAAVNIGVHILFWISVLVSLSKNLEMELLGCVIVLFLVFWGTSIPFSIVAAPIYIPTNSIQMFLFLHILASVCYLHSFWWQILWQVWGGILLWFWFAFPWWPAILSIFSCGCWPSVCLLWKNIYTGLLPAF